MKQSPLFRFLCMSLFLSSLLSPSLTVYGMSLPDDKFIDDDREDADDVDPNFSEGIWNAVVRAHKKSVGNKHLIQKGGTRILSKLATLESKLDVLDSCLCVRTINRSRLQASSAISGTVTIRASGNYYLENDICGTITIDADNVTLDLNSHAITDASSGIIITSNHRDVLIKNGIIGGGSSPTQLGISVGCGCLRTVIEDIAVINCELEAINFSGTAHNPIKSIEVLNCRFENSNIGMQTDNVQGGFINRCSFSSNIIGMSCDESERLVIDGCFAFANEQTGFELKQSSNNCLKNCKAIKSGAFGADNGYGFIANSGSCNVFEDCMAIGTTTNSTSVSKIAAGFALIGSETNTLITRCTSKKTTAANIKSVSSQSKAYGIYIEDIVINCVVKDSLVMGTQGGIGGVGYKADGSKNLIIKNIGYENGQNFDDLINQSFKAGVDSDSNSLGNLSFSTE